MLLPHRILVSSTRKPISYINLAKRFLQEHGEVQLSALGIAVATMVTVAEILKNRRLAVEQKISTSLEALSDDFRCSLDHCIMYRHCPHSQGCCTGSQEVITGKQSRQASDTHVICTHALLLTATLFPQAWSVLSCKSDCFIGTA